MIIKKRYPVITLCGSTKFKNRFLEVQKKLTLEGYIVLSLGVFGHSGDDEVWKGNTLEMLNDMHFQRIDMCDKIYVLNVGGYIGSGAVKEIAYAESLGKEVLYLEPLSVI